MKQAYTILEHHIKHLAHTEEEKSDVHGGLLNKWRDHPGVEVKWFSQTVKIHGAEIPISGYVVRQKVES